MAHDRDEPCLGLFPGKGQHMRQARMQGQRGKGATMGGDATALQSAQPDQKRLRLGQDAGPRRAAGGLPGPAQADLSALR